MVDIKFRKIGIITKRSVKDYLPQLRELIDFLEIRGVVIVLDRNAAGVLDEGAGLSKSEILKTVDLAIVLGGDGTLLKTARRLGTKKVAVLAVNFGNLGFLSATTKENMLKMLDSVLMGNYFLDKRMLLRVTIYRDGKKFATHLALNEAVVNQGAFARLINLRLEINSRKLVNFRADGMIVATPTGSTAHSLSAGGPIVHPELESLVVTPICPSTLSMRPMIMPSDKELKIFIDTERGNDTENLGLTLDGQDVINLKFGDVVKIRKSKRSLYLVKKRNNYYQMLQKKLGFGE